MTQSRTPHRLVLAALLALCAGAASAATSALSESEMSGVYGRGLSEPTLAAFGALSTSEQGASYASAGDVAAVLGSLSASGTQGLERQLAQQRLESATTGLQATLKLAQTMSQVSQMTGAIGALATLPVLGFPLLFAMPALPSLPAIENKH